MAYDLNAIRKKIADSQGGKRTDPHEFKPKKAGNDETILYRFFILPPLSQGDPCVSGVASRDADVFAVNNGAHWIKNRPYGCPRMISGAKCPVCDAGFELLKNIPKSDENARKSVKDAYMAASSYLVNIYFIDDKANPEDLRGQVRWFAAPHSCYNKWSEAINYDGDDPVDPRAHGVFFDENSAYLFQLEVKKNGANNSYTSSKFIVASMPQPIHKNANEIQNILDRRVDLFTKVQGIDMPAMTKLLKSMLNGDDEDESNDNNGFDSDESHVTKPAPVVNRSTTTISENAVVQPNRKDESKIQVSSALSNSKPVVGDDDDPDINALMASMNSDD